MEEKKITRKFELNNESLEHFDEIMAMKLDEISELKVSRII